MNGKIGTDLSLMTEKLREYVERGRAMGSSEV